MAWRGNKSRDEWLWIANKILGLNLSASAKTDQIRAAITNHIDANGGSMTVGPLGD